MMQRKVYYLGIIFGLLAGFVDRTLAQETKDQEINRIISQLDIGEKIDLLCAKAPKVERLDIPAYDWWNECLHGVARNGKATVFPKPIAMGSMWDTELMKRIADAISEEARAKHAEAMKKKGVSGRYEGLTFFSPTLNIARDPRWGRTSECFSEDPLLTSEMGVAFVKGLQGDNPYYLKLVATPKHFVANNEENRRADGSAEVDEVSLREYYFPAFRAAVVQGKAVSFMGAYNALNGVPCCANPFLLTDVLRGEWGFDGVVMSDGSAIGNIANKHKFRSSLAEGAAAALLAGCDMSLRDEYGKGLRQAFEQGLIRESDIDRALTRVLTLRKRLGILTGSGHSPFVQESTEIVECEAHRKLAYEAACKSMILLKNEHLLPLDIGRIKKVSLIGDAFKEIYYGDYSGQSEQRTTLLDALVSNYADRVDFVWAGDRVKEEIVPENCLVRAAQYEYEGKLGLTGYYYEKSRLEGEPEVVSHDLSLNFQPVDVASIAEFKDLSARWISSLVPSVTGEYILSLEGSGNMRLYLDDALVIDHPGNRGKASVSLPLSAHRHYELRIECENMDKNSHFRFLWRLPLDETKAQSEQAVKESDVAIVFIRDNGGAEGRDRNTLALNPEQVSLVKRIAKANANTIVLFGSSAPLVLGEILPSAKALLNVWIGGQGEAQAIADILFGKVNPSGKLPVTLYADEKQLPPLDDYIVKHGRSYQYFSGDVLFPFGFGLSYTAFDYSRPWLLKKKVKAAESVQVMVKVRNTGNYDGDEIVQCYAISDDWKQDGLKRKLVGFARVHLKKGETKNVLLEIPLERLQRWDAEKHFWKVCPGYYQLAVGNHSLTENKVRFRVE